jgi:hypothetical protein
LGKPVEVTRSFRPKKWLKPRPAFSEGVVGSSAIATPFVVEEAPIVSDPLANVADPWLPSAVLRRLRKLPELKPVAAPPSTLMVPASKSISTRRWITPEASVTATVVLPVKPEMAVGRSSPVLRPVSRAGGGTALDALCARFSSSTARATYSPSSEPMFGSSALRRSSRPRSSPPSGVMSTELAPASAAVIRPGAAPSVT